DLLTRRDRVHMHWLRSFDLERVGFPSWNTGFRSRTINSLLKKLNGPDNKRVVTFFISLK
ncbi:MAG: hypothetical protein ACSLE0_08810, partial [Chitinophagaceae bacterium]